MNEHLTSKHWPYYVSIFKVDNKLVNALGYTQKFIKY